MVRSLFLFLAFILSASVTFSDSTNLLEEYGSGNKAQLTKQTTYRFMTWNIYKGNEEGLYADYAHFVETMDFVATQEFIMNEAQTDLISKMQNHHWAFAKSFESGDGWTGVATASQWQAKSSVPVKSPGTEPFAGTPKMSLISLFSIEDGRELMIVNVHGLNFNLGHGDFKEQIDDVVERIKTHKGPMIFAGDFNTWADTRRQYLIKKAIELGLIRLELENEMGIMNATLDHIFVRELNVTQSMVLTDVSTSDHLPLMMEFSL